MAIWNNPFFVPSKNIKLIHRPKPVWIYAGTNTRVKDSKPALKRA